MPPKQTKEEWRNRLKKEFLEKYYNNDFDSGALEMPDPDLESDWWITKLEKEKVLSRQEALQEIKEKIETAIRSSENLAIIQHEPQSNQYTHLICHLRSILLSLLN